MAALIVSLAAGQNEVDALRYSRTSLGGTARFVSMGGAFGALGADFSVLSTNPAGIGLYQNSEFSITPALYFGKTESTHNGTFSDDSKENFNLSNVGLVLNMPIDGSGDLKSFQFAIGLNRLNNYHNRMNIQGVSPYHSMIDSYVEDANGIHYSDLEEDPYGYYAYDLNMAWWTYLLDTVAGMPDRYTGAASGDLLQRKMITTWGSMNEMVLSLGTNYADRLYAGITLGFPYIRYFQESYYSEEDYNNSYPEFKSFELYDYLRTKGTGINFKFGMLLRATDWLRLGGAIHTPTWFTGMSDNWYSRMETYWDVYSSERQYSPDGYFDYKLETPLKAIGSIAFIIGQYGLISADYEYMDYSQSRLRSGEYNFIEENAAIRNVYTSASNLRLGGEYRIDHLTLRGGFGWYGSPFKSTLNDAEQQYYSGGIGYRDKHFFMDLAYVRSVSREDYYLYTLNEVQVNPVKNKMITNNFLLTLGFRY